MDDPTTTPRQAPVARPSRSSDASAQAQLERIRSMSVRERMALALALGRRQAELVRRIKAAAGRRDPQIRFRVAHPYHLVVFKLYAGGAKSALDIRELLARNPQLDHQRLRELCAGYRLDAALDRVLALEV